MEDLIFKTTCEYYKYLNFSRKDVQRLVQILTNYTLEYNQLLKDEILNSIKNAVDDEVNAEIKKHFKNFSNPLQLFSSEEKRLRIYKSRNLYIEPYSVPIGKAEVVKLENDNLVSIHKPVKMIHLDMRHSLKLLLEIDGLFDAMLSYIKYLENDKHTLENFVQGSLWMEVSNCFKIEKNISADDFVIPLIVAHDGAEMGNPLGAHAGKNEVGATYATIPCLPPSFSSKLHSIIVTDLFHSSDRKKFGNEKVFQTLINDLNSLRDDGLYITVNGQLKKIYFLTSLIIGDNLGLNGILGFGESFGNSRFCRICYASPEECRIMTKEDLSLLRTVDKYKLDIENIEPEKTGVKCKCFFNNLGDFHVINNSYCDCMHDYCEGVCMYTMANIINHIVVIKKYLTIEQLNALIQAFDYGLDATNIPPKINLDYIQRTEKLKMSAAEILVLVRYFGCIVGYHIPLDDQCWKLYKYLRSQLHILLAPCITDADIQQFHETNILFNKLYIKLFGKLKPTFHMLIHYPMLLRKLGPLVGIWMMRFESKHRQLKEIISATSSKKDVLITIAKRYLLGIMKFKNTTFSSEEIHYGEIENKDFSAAIDFPTFSESCVLKSVQINNINYKPNVVILTDINDQGLCFGKITHIYKIDEKIIFKYISIDVIGFNSHYYAYSVSETNTVQTIKYEDLILRSPCVIFMRNSHNRPNTKIQFVALKHKV